MSDGCCLQNLGLRSGGSKRMAGAGVGLGSHNFKRPVNVELKLHISLRVI